MNNNSLKPLNNERRTDLDVVKAFGIVLVVIGHVVGSGFFAAKLYHMPLFFFISGLTLKDNRPFSEILKKRITRLYFPFVIYELLFLAFNYPFCQIGIISEQYLSIKEYITAVGHICFFDNYNILLAPIWFLTALFYSSVIAAVIIKVINRIIQNEKVRICLLFGFSLALIYLGMVLGYYELLNIKWSYNFQQIIGVVCSSLGYVILGYDFQIISNKCELKNKTKIGLNSINTILFIFLVIFERLTHLRADMRSNAYDFIPFQPLFALIGICEMFILARVLILLLEKRLKVLLDIIRYIGLHTFSIMCLHPIAFKIISLIQIYIFGMDKNRLPDWQLVSDRPIWLGITILTGIIVPLTVDYLFNVIKRGANNNVGNK